MSNFDPETKKRYAQTATRINQTKIESGAYKQFGVKGKAEDVDIILQAIAHAGGSKTQALKTICQFYLDAQNP